MLKKYLLAILVAIGIVSVFNVSRAAVQAKESLPGKELASTSTLAWQSGGNGYFTLKGINSQYFTAVSGSAKTECFPQEYSYMNLPFALNKYKKNSTNISRMDLTFDKKVEVENSLDLKAAEIYLLVSGNIGNVYPETDNYVYSTDINLVFKYSDGSESKNSAEIGWNWSEGTNLRGINYERTYIGQNPCYDRGALYMIKFTNPHPNKEVKSFVVDDGFTSDYPYTDIMAVTLSTNINNEYEEYLEEWDVAIKFDSAHEGAFYPFSAMQGQEEKFYFKKLDGTDDLYEEYAGREACGGGSGWGDIYEKEGARRAKGWYAERKKISDDEYKISIRGVAGADCNYGGPGYAKGELDLNIDNGWVIDKLLKCGVQDSNKGQSTYCSAWTKKLQFASGSNCGGCCACSDSGSLDIEVLVKNKGIKGEWPGEPVALQISSADPSLLEKPATGLEDKSVFSEADEWLKNIFTGKNIIFAFLAIINLMILIIFIVKMIGRS